MTVLRRVRVHSGLWALLAALGMAVVFVLAATPRTVNRIQDNALRRMLANAPYTTRDVTIGVPVQGFVQGQWPGAAEMLREVRRTLPAELAAAIGSQWGTLRTAPAVLGGAGVTTDPDGLPPRIALLNQTGVDGDIRIVAGRPARSDVLPAGKEGLTGHEVIEVMVAEAVAAKLGVRVGGEYPFTGRVDAVLTVRVTGFFAPVDPTGAAWLPNPAVLQPNLEAQRVRGDDVRFWTAAVLTDPAGMDVLLHDPTSWDVISESRFRVDQRRLTADDAPALARAATRTRSGIDIQGNYVVTKLDELLSEFGRQAAAVRALLAVVAAGIVGTALGLLGLAARLAVDRRRGELLLLRARGAAVHRIAGRLAVEAAVIVVPAAAVGWLAHRWVPGRVPDAPFGTGWAPVVAALLTVVAVPLGAILAERRVGSVARRDVIRATPAPVRRTVEVTAVVLAVLGVVLLHRRGLSQAGVDPYLSAVPVLVGTAVGLLALRVYPWPVRLLDRLAARRTGVAFLGLARAGRAPAAAALPLIVIVLAVAVGGFAGTVRTGIAVARNEAAARAVGGDLRLSAAEFAADSAARVAAVPGVTGVASGYLVAPGMLRSDEDAADPQVVLVALDLRAYQQILTSIGLDVRLPADLLDAGAAGDLPAIASPGAARLPGLVARLGTTERPIRIVDTRRALPGLDRAEFVVVPREAVADPAAVTNLLFVAGPAADPAAVRAAAPVVAKNAALEPLLTAGLFAADGSVTVLSRAEQRIALEHSAFNDGISLAFTAGTAAALLAGLLAIGLALVVDARARGRTLSLLRTMGLGPRQARGLLLVELVPLMVTALAAGGALGVALPRLLAPALGLTAFTAGTPLPIGLDGTTTALLAGLLLMFVTGGVLTEAAANRRLGLGQVLRV